MTELVLDDEVRSAMRGDREAFQAIVEKTATTVCSVALAIVRNVAASEDIAQNAYLAAWTDIRQLRNPGSFLPWLRQIVRNQAHLWLREHSREVTDDVTLATALDSRASADELVIESEQQQLIQSVLDELPEADREVILLYYREGSSARHVSQLLGISEDAVKQRLSRARQRVRDEMWERFGVAATRTSPGVVFVSTVVKAAVTASAAAGILGVFMSMLHLGAPFDEREERELRTFARAASLVMVAASICFAVAARFDTHPPRLWALLTLVTFLSVLGWLYGVRLPRILERRMAWEREVNPEIAAQRRWQQLYATIGQTVGAALGALAIVSLIAAMHC
jgi:RNA polymerase sigma factor (sigma-70 family)